MASKQPKAASEEAQIDIFEDDDEFEIDQEVGNKDVLNFPPSKRSRGLTFGSGCIGSTVTPPFNHSRTPLKLMRGAIGEHDSTPLSTLTPADLHHEMCVCAYRDVQIVAELRQRRENAEKEVEERALRLRELRDQTEKAKTLLEKAEKRIAHITQRIEVIENELAVEVKTGQRFLSSEAGKKYISEVKKSTVEEYRKSADYIADIDNRAMEMVSASGIMAETARECWKQLQGRYPGRDFRWLFPEVQDCYEDEAGPSGLDSEGGDHEGYGSNGSPVDD